MGRSGGGEVRRREGRGSHVVDDNVAEVHCALTGTLAPLARHAAPATRLRALHVPAARYLLAFKSTIKKQVVEHIICAEK